MKKILIQYLTENKRFDLLNQINAKHLNIKESIELVKESLENELILDGIILSKRMTESNAYPVFFTDEVVKRVSEINSISYNDLVTLLPSYIPSTKIISLFTEDYLPQVNVKFEPVRQTGFNVAHNIRKSQAYNECISDTIVKKIAESKEVTYSSLHIELPKFISSAEISEMVGIPGKQIVHKILSMENSIIAEHMKYIKIVEGMAEVSYSQLVNIMPDYTPKQEMLDIFEMSTESLFGKYSKNGSLDKIHEGISVDGETFMKRYQKSEFSKYNLIDSKILESFRNTKVTLTQMLGLMPTYVAISEIEKLFGLDGNIIAAKAKSMTNSIIVKSSKVIDAINEIENLSVNALIDFLPTTVPISEIIDIFNMNEADLAEKYSKISNINEKETWTKYLELLGYKANVVKKQKPQEYKRYKDFYINSDDEAEFEQNYGDEFNNVLSENITSTISDSFIDKMYTLINFGVHESINNLKVSPTFKKHEDSLKYLQEQTTIKEDILIVPHYLDILTKCRYDNLFESELHKIRKKLDANKRVMALMHFYKKLDETSNYNTRGVNEAKDLLFNMLTHDTETNEARFLNITESYQNTNKVIGETRNYLLTEKESLAVSHKSFTILNASGIFEQIDNNLFALHTAKRNLLYDKNGALTELTENTNLSDEFKNLSKMMDKGLVYVTEHINLRANKIISINDETLDIFIEGKQIIIPSGFNVPFTLVNNYNIDEKFIPTFKYVYENVDKFVSFNNGKSITHKENIALNAIIFKINESIFVIKNNNKIGKQTTVQQATISEARVIIKDFINFDIKESLTEMFEFNFIKEEKIDSRKAEILAKIDQLEEELEKIENAIADEDLDDADVLEVKSVLTKNISELRNNYKTLGESDEDDYEWIEAKIKSKPGVFFVKAMDYTTAGKNQELDIKDIDGNMYTAFKKDIKPSDTF